MKEILKEIEERFGPIWERLQRPRLAQVGIEPAKAVPLLTWLKEHRGFLTLVHLSAVDWIEQGEFQLTWLLGNPETENRLMICARIDRENPVAETVSGLWPQAVTYEQEIHEMFGISFPGSPRQGTPFILEGWKEIPPMRRDFDTLAFVERNIPGREGRKHIDTRTYIGEKFGEKGYLHD